MYYNIDYVYSATYFSTSDKTDIDIRIGSSHLILISSQYIEEIPIKFQRKCFQGKVVRVHGFRWKFKVIYKDFQHRIDSVRDGDGSGSIKQDYQLQ